MTASATPLVQGAGGVISPVSAGLATVTTTTAPAEPVQATLIAPSGAGTVHVAPQPWGPGAASAASPGHIAAAPAAQPQGAPGGTQHNALPPVPVQPPGGPGGPGGTPAGPAAPRRGQVLADLALGRLRATGKLADLSMALEGRFTAHHALMCRLHLDRISMLDGAVGDLDAEISPLVSRYAAEAGLLKTIPGFGDVTAAGWLGAIGPAPHEHFATAERLASWVTLCPGNYISARKSKGGRTGDGGSYIKPLPVQAAWAAIPHRLSPVRQLWLAASTPRRHERDDSLWTRAHQRTMPDCPLCESLLIR